MAHPEHGFFAAEDKRAREQARAKTTGRGRIAFGERRHFMQGAAQETAAENAVDFTGTERQRSAFSMTRAAACEPLQQNAQPGQRHGDRFRGSGGRQDGLIPHGGGTFSIRPNKPVEVMFMFCSY